MKLVIATCGEHISGAIMLFELINMGLPMGLLASPAVVR